MEAEGKLLGISVDSAFGKPAVMTAASQLIDCLLDWAKRNYDVEALTPALVSDALAVRNEKKETEIKSRRLLYLFRKYAVGWGADRWEQFAISDKPECAQAGQFMVSWVRFFERPAAPAREVGASLCRLLLFSMRRGAENELFLRVADEVSRIYPENMTGEEYLERVKEVVSSMNLEGGTTEKPGRVFCCGYPSALSVNRKHFVFLGMSWDAFDKLSDEFPLLHDREKEQLSPMLHLIEDHAAENRYAVKAMLANREDAEILFSCAEMNHVGGQEILEASVFGDAARKYKYKNESGDWEDGTPQVTILGRQALSYSDLFLRLGIAETDLETETDEGREDLWHDAFAARNWSATRLETALSCPRRFTLSVQMGLDKEKPEAAEQYGQGWLSSIERGNLIHKILEEYFTQIMPRRDEVDDMLLQSLTDRTVAEWEKKVPVPSNLKDSDILRAEKDKILEIARQEIMLHATDPYRETVAVEMPFGMDGEELYLTFGPYTIRVNGRIDRVDRVGDHYEIIDYKTGNPFYFEEKQERKLQYYLYALAWEKKHPDMPVTLARYDLLDGAGNIAILPVEMTDEKRQEMYDRVIQTLDLLYDPITAMTAEYMLYPPDDPNAEYKCDRYCPFHDLCDGAYKEQWNEGLEVQSESEDSDNGEV